MSQILSTRFRHTSMEYNPFQTEPRLLAKSPCAFRCIYMPMLYYDDYAILSMMSPWSIGKVFVPGSSPVMCICWGIFHFNQKPDPISWVCLSMLSCLTVSCCLCFLLMHETFFCQPLQGDSERARESFVVAAGSGVLMCILVFYVNLHQIAMQSISCPMDPHTF